MSLILGYLTDGRTVEEIILEFPDLKAEQIAACLDYARELAEYEVSAEQKVIGEFKPSIH